MWRNGVRDVFPVCRSREEQLLVDMREALISAVSGPKNNTVYSDSLSPEFALFSLTHSLIQ